MNKIKVGSKIIERGKVFRVFKITMTRYNGKQERVIHYRHHFDDSVDSSLVFSIPESSIEYPDIRKPVSKNEIVEVLQFLSKRTRNEDKLDIADAKMVLNLNDIYKTAEIIKKYHKEKNGSEEDFSKVKRDLLNTAIEIIIEEIALVHKVSLNSAKQQVSLALNGS